MQIIKEGRPQNGWAKEYECTGEGNKGGGCGAVLLVEEGDIYTTYRNSYNETETFYTFCCAACGVETDVPSSDLPGRVSDAARNRRKPGSGRDVR